MSSVEELWYGKRKILGDKIIQMAGPELKEEIEYQLDIEREEGESYDIVDAFEDIEDRADEDPTFHPRQLVKNVRKIAINLGMYKEISDDELRAIASTAGKKYSFILDGKKYIFVRRLLR